MWNHASVFPNSTEILNKKLSSTFSVNKFDKLVFTLGYPKADDTSRRLEFNNPKIRIGTGRPEWGAVPNINYFVITWES